MLVENTYFWCEFEQNEIIGLNARTTVLQKAVGSTFYITHVRGTFLGNRLLISIEDFEACLVKIVKDFCKTFLTPIC